MAFHQSSASGTRTWSTVLLCTPDFCMGRSKLENTMCLGTSQTSSQPWKSSRADNSAKFITVWRGSLGRNRLWGRWPEGNFTARSTCSSPGLGSAGKITFLLSGWNSGSDSVLTLTITGSIWDLWELESPVLIAVAFCLDLDCFFFASLFNGTFSSVLSWCIWEWRLLYDSEELPLSEHFCVFLEVGIRCVESLSALQMLVVPVTEISESTDVFLPIDGSGLNLFSCDEGLESGTWEIGATSGVAAVGLVSRGGGELTKTGASPEKEQHAIL